MNSHPVYQTLPAETFGQPSANPEWQLLKTIAKDVGHERLQRQRSDFGYRMFTTTTPAQRPTKPRRRAKYLSRKARAENHLDHLPKTGWNYVELHQKMNTMWLAYIRNALGQNNISAKTLPNAKTLPAMYAVLSKCDLTGAIIKVVESTNTSNVDVEGILVLETQRSFQVVTKKNELKVLLKEPSVFLIDFAALQFRVFGKSFMMRPHERCVKKLKSFLDLHN